MKNTNKLIALIVFLSGTFTSVAQTAFEKVCEQKVANTSKTTIVGEDGWLFLSKELAHLAKGKFYGDAASKTSACSNATRQDPIPAIVDFHKQLKKQGITLYLMPVPPKAMVNAHKVDASLKGTRNQNAHYKNLYKELKKNGVEVIDLFDEFNKSQTATYCKQDSHWNPKGIEIASKTVADKIKNKDWYKNYSGVKQPEKAIKKTIQIKGDLADGITNTTEKVILNTFQKSSKIDENSPVLVIGDSHTLIFHAGGDMLAKNAGFTDNLAAQLGLNVDLIGVKGSGTSSVRIDLYRKAKNGDWLSKKKAVIWCFAARDFSESTNGWRKVPVMR